MLTLQVLSGPETLKTEFLMTRAIECILDVAKGYDAIILDQWGVLHNGSEPYPGTITALETLRGFGTRLAVLSNSGRRASENKARIAAMGFSCDLFDEVMTSGEAFWLDVKSGRVPEKCFFFVEGVPGDAASWACGLDITVCETPEVAEAILVMGFPENAAIAAWQDVLNYAIKGNLTLYCSNPDRASPRAGRCNMLAPAILAQIHQENGGKTVFHGKPYQHVFAAVESSLGGTLLGHMVPDGTVYLYKAVFCVGSLRRVMSRTSSLNSVPPRAYLPPLTE